MILRVFKALDDNTASIEFWEGDEVVAEVFARAGRGRRLYVSKQANEQGLDWSALCTLMPKVSEMLDQANAEMLDVRKSLGEL